MHLAWRKRKGKDVWDLQIKNGKKLVFNAATVYPSNKSFHWTCPESPTFGVSSRLFAEPRNSLSEAKLECFKWVSECLKKESTDAPIVAKVP